MRGHKYIFKNRSSGHPFQIQSTPNGNANNGSIGEPYNNGVTNNGASATGELNDIIFDVPYNAPDMLWYQCTQHSNMGGRIYVISGKALGDPLSNVFTGAFCGYANTIGEHNTGIGYYAVGLNTSGSDNVGVGYAALYNLSLIHI